MFNDGRVRHVIGVRQRGTNEQRMVNAKSAPRRGAVSPALKHAHAT